MKIMVNGKEDITESNTILDFILSKNLEPKKVIVEYNFKIIKRDNWCSIKLKEKDNLEILNFVGGG